MEAVEITKAATTAPAVLEHRVLLLNTEGSTTKTTQHTGSRQTKLILIAGVLQN